MTLFSAVAETHDPAGAEAEVIARLLERLRRELRELRLAGVLQALEQLELPRIDQELAHDRLPEIAVRLLDQAQVQEVLRIAQESEIVFAAPAAFQLRGIRQQVARLAEQVEPDVGERQVLFERGRMTDPFAETLRQDQARVADAQRIARASGIARAGADALTGS